MPYTKPEVDPEWIKATEVAATLDVDPRTVIRMIRRGDLKVRAIQFGKAVRIHRDDWNAELERRKVVSVGL